MGRHWGIPQRRDPCADCPEAPGGHFHGFQESETRLLLAVGGNGEPCRIVHRTHSWIVVQKHTKPEICTRLCKSSCEVCSPFTWATWRPILFFKRAASLTKNCAAGPPPIFCTGSLTIFPPFCSWDFLFPARSFLSGHTW